MFSKNLNFELFYANIALLLGVYKLDFEAVGDETVNLSLTSPCEKAAWSRLRWDEKLNRLNV